MPNSKQIIETIIFQGEPSKTRRLKSEAAEAIDEEDDDDERDDADDGTKKIADQETEKKVTLGN